MLVGQFVEPKGDQLTMQRRFRRNVSCMAVCLVGTLLIAACGPAAPSESPSEIQVAAVSQVRTGAQSRQSGTTEAFETVMSVLTSSRCIN